MKINDKFYVCVDMYGVERLIYVGKPISYEGTWISQYSWKLDRGTINQILGKPLTFDDGPKAVRMFINDRAIGYNKFYCGGDVSNSAVSLSKYSIRNMDKFLKKYVMLNSIAPKSTIEIPNEVRVSFKPY